MCSAGSRCRRLLRADRGHRAPGRGHSANSARRSPSPEPPRHDPDAAARGLHQRCRPTRAGHRLVAVLLVTSFGVLVAVARSFTAPGERRRRAAGLDAACSGPTSRLPAGSTCRSGSTLKAGRTVALLGPNGAGKSTRWRARRTGTARRGVHPARRHSLRTSHPDARTVRPSGGRSESCSRTCCCSRTSARWRTPRSRCGRAASASARRARRAASCSQRLGVAHRCSASRANCQEAKRSGSPLRGRSCRPRLLLLDEPLSALDVRSRGEVRRLLRELLASFPGVRLLITHDPVEAMTLADRLVLIEHGRIAQEGTPDEILRAPRTPYAAELVGVNLFAGRLERLEDGSGVLRTERGDLVVAWPSEAHGDVDGVLGLLRPADVALFREPPDGSARNVMAGRIASLTRRVRPGPGTHRLAPAGGGGDHRGVVASPRPPRGRRGPRSIQGGRGLGRAPRLSRRSTFPRDQSYRSGVERLDGLGSSGAVGHADAPQADAATVAAGDRCRRRHPDQRDQHQRNEDHQHGHARPGQVGHRAVDQRGDRPGPRNASVHRPMIRPRMRSSTSSCSAVVQAVEAIR